MDTSYLRTFLLAWSTLWFSGRFSRVPSQHARCHSSLQGTGTPIFRLFTQLDDWPVPNSEDWRAEIFRALACTSCTVEAQLQHSCTPHSAYFQSCVLHFLPPHLLACSPLQSCPTVSASWGGWECSVTPKTKAELVSSPYGQETWVNGKWFIYCTAKGH